MSKRSSGILLHITSLPSKFGIGDLGPAAYRFVDFLAEAGQSCWQVLPLNPTDMICGNSPYSSISAFAGNTLLVSPESLAHQGLLSDADLSDAPNFDEGVCDYAGVTGFKERMLDRAYRNFLRDGKDKAGFEGFCEEHAGWLDDYALFVAIKRRLDGSVWSDWPPELRDREASCILAVSKELAEEIHKEKYCQYLFLKQYFFLRDYCRDKGARLIGDIPIYVSYDSAEVWKRPEVFKLGRDGKPQVVAGVPPDYFSKTGQLWGNPVYDWEEMRRDGFEWWLGRMAYNLHLFDVVRVDHFRGLVNFWEVPAGQKTAIDGHWCDVPTDDFFTALRGRFGDLPIIAEDLGLISEEVRGAIDALGFPGMKILLFAFGDDDPKHPYLPRNFQPNCVVYTGTHDNNTARGWFEGEATLDERRRFEEYAGVKITADNVSREMMRLAMESVADTAIIPMQDVLGLGGECRMNRPAQANGNWVWRLKASDVTSDTTSFLKDMTQNTNRAV